MIFSFLKELVACCCCEWTDKIGDHFRSSVSNFLNRVIFTAVAPRSQLEDSNSTLV